MDSIRKQEMERLLDSRSQGRYIKKALLKPEELKAHFDGLPDLSDQVTGFSEQQPALGLFDAETLARVQKAFPRY